MWHMAMEKKGPDLWLKEEIAKIVHAKNGGMEQNEESSTVNVVVDKDNSWWNWKEEGEKRRQD